MRKLAQLTDHNPLLLTIIDKQLRAQMYMADDIIQDIGSRVNDMNTTENTPSFFSVVNVLLSKLSLQLQIRFLQVGNEQEYAHDEHIIHLVQLGFLKNYSTTMDNNKFTIHIQPSLKEFAEHLGVHYLTELEALSQLLHQLPLCIAAGLIVNMFGRFLLKISPDSSVLFYMLQRFYIM